MTEVQAVVLSIAGFDPSSGAGVTADIKTIAAHGCYGVACVTALTVQSTAGVRRVEPVDPGLIAETLEELARDVPIAAVHIGMLDPVLKSSSGSDLLDPAGARLLVEKLLPLATVVTPNVDEAATLTGMKVSNVDEMRAAALRLHEMGSSAVIITGGHLEKAIDLLSFASGKGIEQEVFKTEKLRSNSTHGTGCAFSTSMACHLALDRGLAEATLLAKTYVTAAIAAGRPLGRGNGPLHHLYRMNQQRRAVAAGIEQKD
jgi:hydroxymethylpyrimidine/phosphomethylpyrimidine kinase